MAFYFYYQRAGKESAWELALSTDRERIISEVQPAFTTALDLTGVPADNDWSRTKYTGPLYFDFDADGDLDLVCEQFKNFLGKLAIECRFDVTQARFYASGGKGFHLEIPQECFIAKPSAQGYPWLPYIYREMAQKLVVDTLDLSVYTGKKGRQWRTTNVRRENGKFKVPLAPDEAITITPDRYRELICAPRLVEPPTPAGIHPDLAVLFDQAKSSVQASMRGKKKRQEQANVILDPWRKAKRHPPTILKIMAGEDVNPEAGFNAIAVQLSIYATSVGMTLEEMLEACEGLCQTHVSDSWRYGTPERRRAELVRMWEYMGDNTLYDFDVGPLMRLLRPGVSAPDLKQIVEEATERPPSSEGSSPSEGGQPEEGEEDPGLVVDPHASFRRGVFFTKDGIFVRSGDTTQSICRSVPREVVVFHNLDTRDLDFAGLEALMVGGQAPARAILFPIDSFQSATQLRKLLAAHMIPYQGGDYETTAIFDVMINRAAAGRSKVFTWPREGLSVIRHPQTDQQVYIYITQDAYISPYPPGDPLHLKLRYKPAMATSAYQIDIHRARDLTADDTEVLRDLLTFNRPEVVAHVLSWFLACHYRSAYLATVRSFPVLQVYGEAGAGKTQTVSLMAHTHWLDTERISIKSAASSTEFVLEVDASTSASAPMIIDEFKPREMQSGKNRSKFEKIKDIIKVSYTGGEIGNKGQVNRGADGVGVIKMKASAPIVFMGEALEDETAIRERSVIVALSQSYITPDRAAAFERLWSHTDVLSALGKAMVDLAPRIDFAKMREQVEQYRQRLLGTIPKDDRGRPVLPLRQVLNRAIQWNTMEFVAEHVFRQVAGNALDAELAEVTQFLMNFDEIDFMSQARGGTMSEISKVINRLANLSRVKDRQWGLRRNLDYSISTDENWVELHAGNCYDAYRLYCVGVQDVPLFDHESAFLAALSAYFPTVDKVCADSALREANGGGKVFRLDISRLREAGVQDFKSS